MHIEVVNNIFYFTQNIGCNEDVVTGALATMFYYCPKFTNEFFKKFGINSLVENDDYYVDTGWKIDKNKYNWLRKGVDFKPDIIISNSEDDWDRNKKPENENAIIIETKLFCADLTPKQELNYKNFKSQFSNKIKFMLLSMKDYNDKERHDLFDVTRRWPEVLEIMDDICLTKLEEQESEKIIATELLDFIKLQILPSIDELYYETKICPKKILSNLFDIVRSTAIKKINSKIHVEDVLTVSDHFSKEGHGDLEKIMEKLKPHGVTKESRASFFKIGNGDDHTLYVNCAIVDDRAEFWIDFEKNYDVIHIERLSFEKNRWKDRWFELGNKVTEKVHELISN